MANVHYKIRSADGLEIAGVTDDAGRTSAFTSDKIEDIELFYVPAEVPEDEGVN